MRLARKTRKQRKQLKGGKFLGQGGYGCTFTDPPLPCWNPRGGVLPRRSSDQISKLMVLSEAQKAIDKNRMFRRIDPTETYFISASDSDRCRPVLSAPHINPSDGLDKCHINPQTSGAVELVFFKNGGIDLNTITLSARDYAPFFKSLLNVLEGMRLAHANNIVHLDIKPENIVSQRLPTGEFQTRLIDYDLAIDLNHVSKHLHNDVQLLKNVYSFWPFETIFISPNTNYYVKPSPHDSSSDTQQKQTNMGIYLSNWCKTVANKRHNYSKGFVIGEGRPFSKDGQCQIDAAYYLINYAPRINIDDSNFKKYLKSVDLHMIGLTLGLVMNRFFNYLFVCTDSVANTVKIFVKIKTAAGEKDVAVESLESHGFSKEIQDWHVRVQNSFLMFYGILVGNMTAIDYVSRLSIDKSADYYKLFLGPFDTFFTEDAIRNYLVPLGTIELDDQPVLPDVPSPTNLANIQVSPVSSNVNRPYQIPPTNLRKVQTTLFEGGRTSRQKRRRKTQKKRSHK
jgi:hypothetical protein